MGLILCSRLINVLDYPSRVCVIPLVMTVIPPV
jgi:hypothetical protein